MDTLGTSDPLTVAPPEAGVAVAGGRFFRAPGGT